MQVHHFLHCCATYDRREGMSDSSTTEHLLRTVESSRSDLVLGTVSEKMKRLVFFGVGCRSAVAMADRKNKG